MLQESILEHNRKLTSAADLAEEAWARLEKLLLHYARSDDRLSVARAAVPRGRGRRRLRPSRARARMVGRRRRGDEATNDEAALSRPGDTAARQARASDPRNSVWVSANAGSGKTHVLSQRVIRLLLQGTDPSKILCLTYTRAAAANMSNRVFSTPVRMDDARRRRSWPSASTSWKAGSPSARQAAPGAKTVRRGAGDAGRAEDPDHPRLLRIGAAPVPAGSQHRRAFRDARPADGGVAVRRGAPRHADRRGRRQSRSWPRPSPPCWSAAANSGSTCCCRRSSASATGCAASSTRLGGDTATYAALFEEFGFAPDETAEAIAASVWPLPGFLPTISTHSARPPSLTMPAAC